MDDISDGMKKLLVAIRLTFVSAVILTFALATAIKKPHSNIVSTFLPIDEIAMLADFGVFGNSPASDDSENVADSPEVPVSGVAKKDNKKTEDVEKTTVETEGITSDGNRTYTASSTSGVSSNTGGNSVSTGGANAGSASTTTTTRYYYGDDDAGSPYEQIYIDDNGVEIDNSGATYPIPDHGSNSGASGSGASDGAGDAGGEDGTGE